MRVSAAVAERLGLVDGSRQSDARGAADRCARGRLASAEARGGLPLRTDRSHATIEALRDDVRATAQRGFAIDLEASIVGVALPAVRGPGRAGRCAVGVTLPSRRATNDVVHGLVTAERSRRGSPFTRRRALYLASLTGEHIAVGERRGRACAHMWSPRIPRERAKRRP